ncbi:xyloglucan O-acetyltransferase 2-like [Lolium perenne]|uniref:xyloglucan O-acetyltransferase 2-like n=1 Tax=Lolium perenne TaxID=4522 RepID=UPI0021EA7564|nr:xyloglucan O-acetyltransferase 2-like [Lolium perenne]
MGASTPRHHSSSLTLPRLVKKILTLSLYALVPLGLLHYLLRPTPVAVTSISTSPLNGQNEQQGVQNAASGVPARKQPVSEASPAPRCDYSEGEWVRNAAGPRYNGTSCGATIKDGQNCMAHGRPDTGYLHWRWQPRGCALPPFAPAEFLEQVRGRHVAFVGDSLARNQCESLVCLLASEFPAELVLDGGEERKFRRWAFPSHDATVSVFWSPFLVNGTEKSSAPGGLGHNRLYFDQPDERWAAEVTGIDVVVLSFGQWFMHPAMYYDGGEVIGCHHCPEPNRTETSFFGVFRLAVKNALREVIARAAGAGREKLAVVTTFSPGHFVGEWDSPDACSRTEPYAPGEKELPYMERELSRAEAEEVAAAADDARARGSGVTVEALEVTRLADMRADGHPGPYMHAFPFGDGGGEKKTERVPNDCVHWCLPGPIDTWNEILLQMVKRWRASSSSR